MRFLLFVILLTVLASSAFAASSIVPTIYNPGFEEKELGWGWHTMGGCKAWYKLETENPHSGERCMTFINQSGFAPNVYGRFQQTVAVLPETKYDLSMWVRGEDVQGKEGASHFTDWQCYTLNLPTGTFDWTKVSATIKTNPGQYSLILGFNTIHSCKVLAIDDISLKPIGVELKGEGISGSFLAPPTLIGHDSPGYLRVFVESHLDKPATVNLAVTSGKSTVFAKRGTIKKGENDIDWEWTSGKVPFGEMDCIVRITDSKGKVIAEASQKVKKQDAPLFAELDRVEARLKNEFMPLYKECQAKGLAVDYPAVTKTTIEQFLPLFREDVRKAHNWRVDFGVKDFDRSLNEAIAAMQAYLKDPKTAPNVVRYQTSKAEIKGSSFIADRKDSTGKKDRGPVFLVGYGHFVQARKDMPRWPGYGINIIQSAEFGPSAVFPEEGKVSLDMPKILVNTLDNAAKHNVKVDFLISPHYFPNWVIRKYPHLAKGGGGFLGFVPDEKEAKQIMEDFLKIVIPMVKDKPALHSICLSNEPLLFDTARADNTKPIWTAHLKKVHGDIQTLNTRYGKSYKSFDDVPMAGNINDPQYYDWCVYTAVRFTGWHKWMADVIHKMAPGIPVHAKTMSTWFNRDFVGAGCDPEMFGEMGQIAGNDCYFVGGAGGGWSVPWHFQNMAYDLQRSVTGKPIFNSENHLNGDKAQHYVAPEHYRTALWQGAVHGQSATTIWAWERCYDPGYDLYGLILDRPGCAEAVGKTSLDLNSYADEIAAVQAAKSPVAILYSVSAVLRDGGAYLNAVNGAYVAYSFHGFKVDFITEKQLREGKGAQYKMVVFPESAHVESGTFEAIRKLPESVKIVLIGECLAKDPYNNTFPADQVKAIRDRSMLIDTKFDGWALWPKMREELAKVGGLPEVSVIDTFTGETIQGVEWLPAKVGDRTIISIVNLKDKPMNVRILVNGKRTSTRNLLSVGGRDYVRVINPATPVLAEVEE